MAEGKENRDIVPLSDEEIRLAFSSNAVVANRVLVNVGPLVRLTFIEQVKGAEPRVVSAVALHHQDAVAFKKVLSAILDPIEKQINEALASQRDKGNVPG